MHGFFPFDVSLKYQQSLSRGGPYVGDRGLTDRDLELEELAMDPGSTPQWLVRLMSRHVNAFAGPIRRLAGG